MKVGPPACKEPKVVQVPQEQMVQRYGGIYRHGAKCLHLEEEEEDDDLVRNFRAKPV